MPSYFRIDGHQRVGVALARQAAALGPADRGRRRVPRDPALLKMAADMIDRTGASGRSATRRTVLQGALGLGVSLVIRPAVGASAPSLDSAIRVFASEAPVKVGRVVLDVAPLVENGNAVPVTVSVESPMTAADHVRRIAIFNELQSAARRRRLHARAARRAGARRDADPPRDLAAARRGRADERRHLLAARGRRDRHARRLHRELSRWRAR